jgi:putative flippase GtrA
VWNQFARYLALGGLAFAVDFSSLYVLTEFAGFYYLVSAAVAFMLGLVANYLLSRGWVFSHMRANNTANEFVIFGLIGGVGLGLNEAIIWFAHEQLHVHYLRAKAISAVAVLIWNFGAGRTTLVPGRPLGVGAPWRTSRREGLTWPAGVAAAYFLFCLGVQASTGAWQADFVAHSDEASHFVGATMIRAWILSGHWTEPFRFASDYYSHYPFFAIGYWPPMFYLVTAFHFLLFGIGRMQSLLVPAACAATSAWLVFRLLRPSIGAVASACAGAIYLSVPEVQAWYCAAMVDHMTACLCVATSVCLLAYLKRPKYKNGIVMAFLCACAVLSKYSAAYIVVLPGATILLSRRFSLFRRPSFLIQPVIVALMVVPWVLWTKGLTYYGLPAARPALTAGRAALFLTENFAIFPPVLMAVVIAGLIALMILPSRWREDVGVLALAYAGHLSLLFLSNVGAERRYLLAPIAFLLVISFAGWGEALSRVRVPRRYYATFRASVAVLTAAFLLVYCGRYERPKQYPIQPIVETVLENRLYANQRVVVPSDLEGPFIAGFVAQERGRISLHTLRPRKLIARSDWFGENYAPLFHTPEQILECLRQNGAGVVIWHERPEAAQRPHERLLGEMLRRYPRVWHKVETFEAKGEEPCWAIYEDTSTLLRLPAVAKEDATAALIRF